MTLRSHLLLLVVVIAVPLLFFAALAIFLVAQREDQAVEEGLRDTALALALAIDRELEASVSTLQGLATSEHLETGRFSMFYEEAKRVRAAHEAWPSVFLIDASGQEIFSLLVPFGSPLPNVGNQPDVVEAMRSARPYISDLLIGPVSRRPVVRVHVPVLSGGRVKYLLAATLPPATITDLLRRQPMSHDAVALVLDRTGVTIARTRDGQAWLGHRAPREVLDVTSTGRDGFFTSTALDNRRDDVAFSHVPNSDFVVVVARPRAAASAGWFWWVTAVLAVLAAALVFAIVMANRISRPILGLAAKARALGRGESVPDERGSSIDEIEVVREALVQSSVLTAERAREREQRLAADAANRAKDEFLAMLGHELRNPLGSIATAAHVLTKTGADSARATRAIEIIRRQVAHLGRLVDDVFDVSRVIAGKVSLDRHPVDLAAVVRHSVDGLRAAGRLAEHPLGVDAEPVWVDADDMRLEQVIANLVTNAVKYSPAGAPIRVTVRPDEQGAVLRVEDRGIGIPPELLPRIFNLFVQGDQELDRPAGGLGIGLTLVRRLVELQGGTIEASSAGPGSGSTFSVRLPRVAPPVSVRAPDTGAARPAPRRVLVVEDNPDAREMLRHWLELDGHQVFEAEDGRRAVELALTTDVDVALVDLGLPGIDGYEVARQVRAHARGRSLRLIAVTGYGQEDDRRRTVEVGFDAHVVKPIDPERLIAVLGTAGRPDGG